MRMMRRTVMALVAVTALAACQGGGISPSSNVAASHTALVAATGGDFIWDCNLNSEAGTFPARFLLQRKSLAVRPEIVMLSAGSGGRLVDIEKEEFARIYKLRDNSGLLIATDGSIYGLDVRGRPLEMEIIGTCNKGAQSI